jgi:hypothetical protein
MPLLPVRAFLTCSLHDTNNICSVTEQRKAVEGSNAVNSYVISYRDDVTTNTNISGDVKSAAVEEFQIAIKRVCAGDRNCVVCCNVIAVCG